MADDYTIPQRWEHYSAQDHAVWKTLFERQTALLPGLACAEFVEGMRQLPISANGIPNFAELNGVLQQQTGWQVVAVPGLVPDEVFFEHLANRRFPSGNFIQLYGEAGLRAQRIGKLTELARVYWYTVEFGLVKEQMQGERGVEEALRIYGAGIASSFTESGFAVQSASPHRIGFELERVMRTNYRIDDFQECYFVLDSLDDLLALARIDFDPIYERLNSGPTYSPGDVLPTDQVFHHGDGIYARSRVPALA